MITARKKNQPAAAPAKRAPRKVVTPKTLNGQPLDATTARRLAKKLIKNRIL
jgi:hypothetical protein